MECLKELGRPSFEPIIADYYDGAVAIVECSRRHKSAFILQGQKFEILFESGASALLEGYTIEAASSFSAALERFYEFCVRVFRAKDGLDETEFNATFRQMSHQSERQLGAFMYLYLQNFGKSYRVKNKLVEFRNKVVHKGYIPAKEETENYGANIFDEIHGIYKLLKDNLAEHVMKAIVAEMNDRGRNLPPDMPRSTVWQASFFDVEKDNAKVSFREALASYKERQEKLTAALPEMEALSKSITGDPVNATAETT